MIEELLEKGFSRTHNEDEYKYYIDLNFKILYNYDDNKFFISDYHRNETELNFTNGIPDLIEFLNYFKIK